MKKKILCTLGPASLNPLTIQRLDDLKVDLFRLNLSHTPVEQIEGLVTLVRANSQVPICLDTQGAQVRTGPLVGGQLTLESGSEVSLVATPTPEDSAAVSLYPASVLPQLVVGDLISIDFETALLQVIEAGSTCRARVLTGGTIGSNKAVAVIDHPLSLPPLTEVDDAGIEEALRLGLRHIALSFANRRRDVELLRSRVGKDAQIIAKIESQMGLGNLEEILQVADAILIDRGDLSREVPLERLPFIQKDIIGRANESGVPVYVATNLLESMVVSKRPTRAEVNDVVNTLLDGADGLVLAAETAIGEYPVSCVSMVRGLIHELESPRDPSPSHAHLASTSPLIPPHGGRLVHRITNDYDDQAIRGLPRIEVDDRTMMDVGQIATGTFSPLEGFMGRDMLENVLAKNQLPDGTVWPMPILLQLPPGSNSLYPPGERLALAHEGEIRALLHVEECFSYELEDLSVKWFGTSDPGHPGVERLLRGSDEFLAGKVVLLSRNLGHRQPYELTPAQARLIFDNLQWQRVVGFHTRNVPHRAHEYLQFTALEQHQCDGIFIHPVTGPKKTGDYSGPIILSAYQLLVDEFYPPNKALLGGFLTYSRYAGPREAVFTALCRKNFGCSHFIVGRDHTGVGSYYSPEASQRLFDEIGDIGIQSIFFDEVYHCRQCMAHVERCSHGIESSQRISGTQAREILKEGQMPPNWYMREPVSRLILEELKNGTEVFAG